MTKLLNKKDEKKFVQVTTQGLAKKNIDFVKGMTLKNALDAASITPSKGSTISINAKLEKNMKT